jgi:hypothetical protein
MLRIAYYQTEVPWTYRSLVHTLFNGDAECNKTLYINTGISHAETADGSFCMLSEIKDLHR